jgi:hypothetical protein
MQIEMSKYFEKQYNNSSEEDADKIDDFREYVEKYGLQSPKGLNKNSDAVNNNYHFAKRDLQFAHDNKLWHYHVGIPYYNTSKGLRRYTSEKVIHYQRFSDHIKLVLLGDHSPFRLPSDTQLEHLI